MAEDIRLSAEKRELLGSANTRRLRKQGRVPANLYGFQKDSVNVSILAEDIEKMVAAGSRVVDVAVDGSVEKAVVRELQWDIYSTYVKHVDLLRVDPEAITTVEVPLVVRGEPIGLKDGGQLRQLEKKVTVTCPEIRVPKNITVRVASLKVGDSVSVGDLEAPDTVKIDTASDTLVVELFDPKKSASASE
ncbi:MAG: 50S ribosomal protein L25 [Fuerstiella sp.]|nr:50S ribosomal protein L25 [Fuerstiella sp.]